MKTGIKKFSVEIIWNREFHFVSFGDQKDTLEEAKNYGRSLLYMGDGARVKKFRVLDSENNVVYPVPIQTLHSEKMYVCSFCGKKEKGKPYSYLKNPSNHLDHTVALRPDGWDWDIVPVKFTDLWSCGCHKIQKTI